jgi:hypothetical protein
MHRAARSHSTRVCANVQSIWVLVALICCLRYLQVKRPSLLDACSVVSERAQRSASPHYPTTALGRGARGAHSRCDARPASFQLLCPRSRILRADKAEYPFSDGSGCAPRFCKRVWRNPRLVRHARLESHGTPCAVAVGARTAALEDRGMITHKRAVG